MKTEILSVGPLEVNCAIVQNETGQALIIDPGADATEIQAVLQKHALTVAAYLLTHGHVDHLSALAELHSVRPAPVYIHAADFTWAFGPRNQIPPWYSVPEKPDAEFIHPENLAVLSLAGLDIRVLETPGHTPGSVCYYFEKESMIFTGDTLFKGSCGRTDLPGGDGRVLAQSLKKLAALPDDVAVCPGHNDSTTIGHEKRSNFFMQQAASKI